MADDTEPSLLDLVDQDRIDEVLERVTLSQVTEAVWLENVEHLHTDEVAGRDHEAWWAVGLWMSEEFLSREELVREGLLQLVERSDDPDWLGYIGAFMLESFVEDNEDRLRWIEEQAAKSENFRTALGNVWISRLPDHVFARVEQAADKPLARPKN